MYVWWLLCSDGTTLFLSRDSNDRNIWNMRFVNGNFRDIIRRYPLEQHYQLCKDLRGGEKYFISRRHYNQLMGEIGIKTV